MRFKERTKLIDIQIELWKTSQMFKNKLFPPDFDIPIYMNNKIDKAQDDLKDILRYDQK